MEKEAGGPRGVREGGGGGARPQVEKDPGGRRRAVTCGGDGETGSQGGTVARRGERNGKNPRNVLAGGASLILQTPLQQLLEHPQWT
jgi:hypothetical protein